MSVKIYDLTIVLSLTRELKKESYGVDLLQAIGFVYVSKAKQHLATNQTFLGVGGWIHNVQGKYHVFSETFVLTCLQHMVKRVHDIIYLVYQLCELL